MITAAMNDHDSRTSGLRPDSMTRKDPAKAVDMASSGLMETMLSMPSPFYPFRSTTSLVSIDL